MFENIILAKSARFIWKIGEKYLYLPRDIIITLILVVGSREVLDPLDNYHKK